MSLAQSHWGSPVPTLGMAHIDGALRSLWQVEVWQCINLDSVFVVSIDIGDVVGASHT